MPKSIASFYTIFQHGLQTEPCHGQVVGMDTLDEMFPRRTAIMQDITQVLCTSLHSPAAQAPSNRALLES